MSKIKHSKPRARSTGIGSAAAVALLAALLAAPAHAQAPYATPEQAATAFITAVQANDVAGFAKVLGNDWRQLLPPGGVPPDELKAFLNLASQAHGIKVKDGRALMAVGADPYVLPIPIVQGKDSQWRFDVSGGREAVLERRIGFNERWAMKSALAYLDAQREYAQADRNGDGVLSYALKFFSSPGKRDGLIWSSKLGDESPLGEGFVSTDPKQGYHGYHFKILTSQSARARGGARDYMLGKHMVGGYALIAWPVDYGRTGVMTFMVNHDGVIYQRDLGYDTELIARETTRFDPDIGWTPTQP